MLRKVCPLSGVKMSDAGNGSIEGYASTFGNFDRAGEAVVKGAFAGSLDDALSAGFGAVGHNWAALPIGTLESAQEDDKGLYVKIDFHSTPEAQAARTVCQERLARGKSVAFSIGYEVLEKRQATGGLLLTKLHLFEVSIVTVPCNPQALATGVKDLKTKGVLSAYLPQSMTMAAVNRANDALYYAIYDELYRDAPVQERLDVIEQACDEFRDLVLNVAEAILSGAQDAIEQAAAEIKATHTDPRTKTATQAPAIDPQKLLQLKARVLAAQSANTALLAGA